MKIVPIFENSQGQCPRIPIFYLLYDKSCFIVYGTMGYMEAVNVSAEASMTDSIGDAKDSTSYVERQGAVRSNN